ncbi:hypothetical protein [Nocardia jejuensis]|uniref:hypothetical protein n=1 Tax=Nocardia jejuensis TaxID=328049 RepID=UPI000836EC56|nr:hypothetical protein [Nocardia jejuensis]
MRTPSRARTALLFGGLAAATTLTTAAPCSAQNFEFPQVPSMFRDGICGASIRTWAETSPEWPGRAIVNVKSLPIVGVGPGEWSFAPLCETGITVAWRNMNTGAVGEYRETVVSGIYGSIQYARFQDTGPGHIEVSIFTDTANIPQRGSFEVPSQAAAPAPRPTPPEGLAPGLEPAPDPEDIG